MKNTNLTRAAASLLAMRHGFWPDCLRFQRILQRSNRRERSFQRSCR